MEAKMKIKVSDANVERLEAELNRANGKSKKNTATAIDVILTAERAERNLEHSGVPVRERNGAEVTWNPAGPQARAYGFKMTRTRLKLLRCSKDWFLTDAHPHGVHPRQPEFFSIAVSPAQHDRIVKDALVGYRLRNDEDIPIQ
jgi:hypothetical protein